MRSPVALPTLVVALLASTAFAQAPVQVTSFGARPDPFNPPMGFAQLGSLVLFSATTPVAGTELWKTDGTPGGTALVLDINPGAASSSPTSLFAFGGFAYFSATDGTNGRELRRTDGTAAGTTLVLDLNVAGSSDPSDFAALGSTLLFAATQSLKGRELYAFNGASVALVKDLDVGSGDSSPQRLTLLGTRVVFTAKPFGPASPSYLFATDGTATGTVQLGTVSNPNSLVALGSRIVFAGAATSDNQELWSTDGTTANTVLVKEIQAGSAGSMPSGLTVMNGAAYFSADDGVNGPELWKSDGTPGNATMVVDLNPGARRAPRWTWAWAMAATPCGSRSAGGR